MYEDILTHDSKHWRNILEYYQAESIPHLVTEDDVQYVVRQLTSTYPKEAASTTKRMAALTDVSTLQKNLKAAKRIEEYEEMHFESCDAGDDYNCDCERRYTIAVRKREQAEWEVEAQPLMERILEVIQGSKAGATGTM